MLGEGFLQAPRLPSRQNYSLYQPNPAGCGRVTQHCHSSDPQARCLPAKLPLGTAKRAPPSLCLFLVLLSKVDRFLGDTELLLSMATASWHQLMPLGMQGPQAWPAPECGQCKSHTGSVHTQILCRLFL